MYRQLKRMREANGWSRESVAQRVGVIRRPERHIPAVCFAYGNGSLKFVRRRVCAVFIAVLWLINEVATHIAIEREGRRENRILHK